MLLVLGDDKKLRKQSCEVVAVDAVLGLNLGIDGVNGRLRLDVIACSFLAVVLIVHAEQPLVQHQTLLDLTLLPALEFTLQDFFVGGDHGFYFSDKGGAGRSIRSRGLFIDWLFFDGFLGLSRLLSHGLRLCFGNVAHLWSRLEALPSAASIGASLIFLPASSAELSSAESAAVLPSSLVAIAVFPPIFDFCLFTLVFSFFAGTAIGGLIRLRFHK